MRVKVHPCCLHSHHQCCQKCPLHPHFQAIQCLKADLKEALWLSYNALKSGLEFNHILACLSCISVTKGGYVFLKVHRGASSLVISASLFSKDLFAYIPGIFTTTMQPGTLQEQMYKMIDQRNNKPHHAEYAYLYISASGKEILI